MPSLALATLALAASASAATVPVIVGAAGLDFNPSSVTAKVGDVLEFDFRSLHDVVQSAYNSPCISSDATKIFSGVLSTGKFSVKVNSTDPLWLYCSVGRHCQNGMVMVVNPPATGNTLAAYRSAAAAVQSATAPQAVIGGILGNASAFGSNTAATTGSSVSTPNVTASGTSTTPRTNDVQASPAASVGSAASASAAGAVGASLGLVALSGALALAVGLLA